jgi:hypothetical protein
MADGPALTDPLDVWEEAYGDAMVDRNEGDPTMVRSFDIQLDDGPVGAQQLTPGQGTARVWEVNAGASCDDAG